jgi:hypothetical protein
MAPAKAAPKSRISQDVQALGIIVTNIRKNPEIGEAMGTVGYGPLRLDAVHESYAPVLPRFSRSGGTQRRCRRLEGNSRRRKCCTRVPMKAEQGAPADGMNFADCRELQWAAAEPWQ